MWPVPPVPPGRTLCLSHAVVSRGRGWDWVPTGLDPEIRFLPISFLPSCGYPMWDGLTSVTMVPGWETHGQEFRLQVSGASLGPWASTFSPPALPPGGGAWASPQWVLDFQGGIPLLAAGQCDAVHACAGIWWAHATGHRHLPAVGPDLLLHGHITYPTLSPAPGHC